MSTTTSEKRGKEKYWQGLKVLQISHLRERQFCKPSRESGSLSSRRKENGNFAHAPQSWEREKRSSHWLKLISSLTLKPPPPYLSPRDVGIEPKFTRAVLSWSAPEATFWSSFGFKLGRPRWRMPASNDVGIEPTFSVLKMRKVKRSASLQQNRIRGRGGHVIDKAGCMFRDFLNPSENIYKCWIWIYGNRVRGITQTIIIQSMANAIAGLVQHHDNCVSP